MKLLFHYKDIGQLNMFIQFDKKAMHVQVLCGIMEKYTPNANVKKIYGKVSDLKKEMDEFMEKKVGPALKEIEDLVAEENQKQQDKLAK